MKARTILSIREMLREKRDKAQEQFDSVIREMAQKYGVEAQDVEDVLNFEDTLVFCNERNSRNMAQDLLDDFERHNW